MPKIAGITDTNASLPPDLANKYSIQQVPILIQFGEECFRAVQDIDDVKTFARIDSSGKLPTTSAPSPGQFVEAYRNAFDQGADGILCFTVDAFAQRSLLARPLHDATGPAAAAASLIGTA